MAHGTDAAWKFDNFAKISIYGVELADSLASSALIRSEGRNLRLLPVTVD
jgi:hypothetical protein